MIRIPPETITALRKAVTPAFLAAAVCLAPGCGTGSGDGGEAGDGTDDVQENVNREGLEKTTRKIFYAIPSPLEMAMLIKKAGTAYNKDLLNPIEHVNNYVTSYQQALNLGIYGADLSYTSMFDQTQESLFYLSCARNLAGKLGIAGAFDESTVNRLEANLNNKDSIMEIISDAYWTSDTYLKESERYSTSSLVIAGGWIEGLYIASRLAVSNKGNSEIKARIADQKSSLENLIGLMSTEKGDEQVSRILDQLLELKVMFDGITEKDGGDVSVATNEEDGTTTIGGGTTLDITDDQLVALDSRISAIRNGIINVN